MSLGKGSSNQKLRWAFHFDRRELFTYDLHIISFQTTIYVLRIDKIDELLKFNSKTSRKICFISRISL